MIDFLKNRMDNIIDFFEDKDVSLKQLRKYLIIFALIASGILTISLFWIFEHSVNHNTITYKPNHFFIPLGENLIDHEIIIRPIATNQLCHEEYCVSDYLNEQMLSLNDTTDLICSAYDLAQIMNDSMKENVEDIVIPINANSLELSHLNDLKSMNYNLSLNNVDNEMTIRIYAWNTTYSLYNGKQYREIHSFYQFNNVYVYITTKSPDSATANPFWDKVSLTCTYGYLE